ncbi:Tnp P element domain containing protein [Asbolus verrucosus]|uniref:Tnp P element domain containing protein n=1 Tax=Asbolus verrucosus TaxID=1661398 RepID=A0A482V7I1_ASBVE|nr:Tnp P element domain containing protein [Asbolus verrucosus]
MKHNPRGYKLLQKLFALPSRKILMAVLRKVPVVWRKVSTLSDRDKHCVTMQCNDNEISLQPSLFYNLSEDRMDGLEDDGAYRTTKIADHAMVLMLKGVSKKWKQPIAYFFTENGMKSLNVAKYIKAAIHEVQAIGLKVVATMCDRFNKPTINLLVEESRSELAKKGEQHQTYSFFINGREVMPLYDPPHLLKGIRNNMLNGVEKLMKLRNGSIL